jgi:hypothetical protein
LPPVDESLLPPGEEDPCEVNPNAPGCGTEPIDPCEVNPDLPECEPPPPPPPVDCPSGQHDGGGFCVSDSPPPDPCIENPDLPGCTPPPCVPGDPSCPPQPCDPTKQPCPPKPIRCGPGTHLENGICVRDKNGNGGSSSSSSATATANVIAAEVSSCKLDGNAYGIQQKFDSIKYQACGLYANGQKAYSDGFIAGCTQAGNTQLMCLSFVELNTSTQLTQPQTQSAIQPPQAIQPVQ